MTRPAARPSRTSPVSRGRERRAVGDLTAAIERLSFGLVAVTALAIDGATTRHTLTFQQWRALVVVGRAEEGVRISQLASRIGASAPSTSRLVRRLAAKGMFTVAPDPADGRAMRVRLSPGGEELRRRVIEGRRAIIASTVSGTDVSGVRSEAIETLADAFEPFV